MPKTGRDLILVGFTGETSDLGTTAGTVQEAVLRSLAELQGSALLTVMDHQSEAEN